MSVSRREVAAVGDRICFLNEDYAKRGGTITDIITTTTLVQYVVDHTQLVSESKVLAFASTHRLLEEKLRVLDAADTVYHTEQLMLPFEERSCPKCRGGGRMQVFLDRLLYAGYPCSKCDSEATMKRALHNYRELRYRPGIPLPEGELREYEREGFYNWLGVRLPEAK